MAADPARDATALAAAVRDLDRAEAARLLATGAGTEARDPQRRTPLMLAALHGDPVIVRALLAAGADVNAQAPGAPARGLGADDARAIAEREGAELRTPLSFAVESGELEVVEILLASGANPYNAGATTPLDLAVLGGDAEIVRVLLDAGADPNGRDSEGDSPLMIAAAGGDPDTIAALIERGAIVSARNDDGDDALAIAARSRRADAVAVLAPYYSWLAAWRARRALRSRRKPSASSTRSAERIARFHQDALNGRLAAVRKALAAGLHADCTRRDEDGATALMEAVRGGHPTLVRLLVRAGADPNHCARGETPLTIALGPRSLDPRARCELVRTLVGAGADVEQTDADGLTPLMHAVMVGRGDEAAIATLVDLGADPTARHVSGMTALELARQDPAKAHLVARLEALAKRAALARDPGGAGDAIGGAGGALRPAPDRPVETLRGLGRSGVSEVVLAVRAPIDAVSPTLEALRGGRQWSRGIYAREGFFPGEEGYLVYQLRGHAWTLVQSDLIDRRALRAADAAALSRALDCDALCFEICEAADILRYSLHRSGTHVERFDAFGASGPGAEAGLLISSLREVDEAERLPAIDFVDASFASLELFVPGFGDDRIASLAREFEPEHFERVDFLRVDLEAGEGADADRAGRPRPQTPGPDGGTNLRSASSPRLAGPVGLRRASSTAIPTS